MKNAPYSEYELLEIASGFKKHLKDNFATIKSADPNLDQNFIYRFKALYYEIHTHSLNPGADSIAKSLKGDLENLENQIRILFPVFRFYLQKTFPHNSNYWEPYGYCEMERMAHDYSSLRKCLEGTVKLINEKRSELRTAGCSESTLNDIINLSKQITYKHEELLECIEKIEIRNRAFKTRLNELFQLMEIVHEAASKCLYKDPETLKYLTFPQKEQVH
jgi:hypothetical protein